MMSMMSTRPARLLGNSLRMVNESAELAFVAAALHIAVIDAASHQPRQAADARFWLEFGGGADFAEMAGVGAAIANYLAELPPLPGQDPARPPALEYARMITEGAA